LNHGAVTSVLDLCNLHCKLNETTPVCEVKVLSTAGQASVPYMLAPGAQRLLSFMTVLLLLCTELLQGLAEVSISTFHNLIPNIQSKFNPQASRI